MRYKRILLKLSGQAVSGSEDFGFDPNALEHIAEQVLALHAEGVEVSIVIGGGNIFRGNMASHWGIERAEADNIGMMGTIINSLMLRGVLTAGDFPLSVGNTAKRTGSSFRFRFYAKYPCIWRQRV